jgi:hypothetical protein
MSPPRFFPDPSGADAAIDRNATNPRIGSRLQYACDFRGR